MKDNNSHRKTFKRELETWGEVVACDHVYSAESCALGLDNETEAFVIKDLWSGLIHAYPFPSKASIFVMASLLAFCGTCKVETLYSDSAE
jgi:hypothetical protein